MADEENKKIKKVMMVPPPPNSGDEPIRVVMKGDPNKVIKVVTKKQVTTNEVSNEVALRDENVQEILTSVPHWMIRWGNFLFLGLLLMIIGISWMVKYPDVVNTPITLESTNSDVNIVYDEQKVIQKILVTQGQIVTKNTPLLVFENDANIEDVHLLNQVINSVVITSNEIKIGMDEIPPLTLGSLQIPFVEFQADYHEYNVDKKNINKLEEAIKSFEKLHQKLQEWNQQNILKAPVNGNIKLLTTEMNLKTGDIILKIDSNEEQAFFSHIISENSEFQKIETGQEVQISLAAYPVYENGVLIGKVASVIWDAALKKYVVQISFPNELKTSYGIPINPETNLSGIASIITERKRLVERFFSSF